MNDIRPLHDEAMDLAEAAGLARIRNDPDNAAQLLRRAYELERNAAALCSSFLDLEPTRSVLHRSAASLAIDCGEYREAERLIAVALSGEAPEEIKEELRDLLEQVYFHRHLALRGLSLAPDEFQLAIAGKAIGFGIAPTEEYVDRIQALEKMVYRTAERKMGIHYRERGNPEKDIKENFEVFLSVPRAASMAVTLRIGQAKQEQQLKLGFSKNVSTTEVIDEIVYALEILNIGNPEDLKTHINDQAYYTNFIALAKRIAPDGEDVRVVGLTVLRNGGKREIPLTKTSKQLSGRMPRRSRGREFFAPTMLDVNAAEIEAQSVEAQGRLKFADSTGGQVGTVKLVEKTGAEHTVIVPEGMMSDIVRPLWDSYVSVIGTRTGSGILLEDIKRLSK